MIYALVHPDTLEIRYVGKTNNTVVRKHDHRKEARLTLHRRWPVYDWWRYVVSTCRCEPSLVVLGEGYSKEEQEWISKLLSEGARLLNLTKGGDGGEYVGQRAYMREHNPMFRPDVVNRVKATQIETGAQDKRVQAALVVWRNPESRGRIVENIRIAAVDRWGDPVRRASMLAKFRASMKIIRDNGGGRWGAKNPKIGGV